MRLSYSSFDSYKNCPLKYKLQTIDKLKEPKKAVQMFGTLLHSVMEYIHKPGFFHPTLEQALELFATKFNDLSPLFENEIDERTAFTQGVTILQAYYKKNDPSEAIVVDLESRFAIELLDPKTNEVHIISGIIDRIDKTENGYEIIDYKTAGKMPSQQMVDDNMQLSVYTRAFLKRYPKEQSALQNITVSLYFLKHNAKLSSTRTMAQLEELDAKFLDVIHDIEAQKFDPRVSPLCEWCGFQKICPMWRHKFKEERKVETQEVQTAIKEYLDIKERAVIDRRRLGELQSVIAQYMDQEGVERIFGETKIIERSVRTTYAYDIDSVRRLLEPKGLFARVIKIDGTALKKVSGELPFSLKKELEGTKKVDKETRSLTVKKQ
jgi:putative RecB family exonuclease